MFVDSSVGDIYHLDFLLCVFFRGWLEPFDDYVLHCMWQLCIYHLQRFEFMLTWINSLYRASSYSPITCSTISIDGVSISSFYFLYVQFIRNNNSLYTANTNLCSHANFSPSLSFKHLWCWKSIWLSVESWWTQLLSYTNLIGPKAFVKVLVTFYYPLRDPSLTSHWPLIGTSVTSQSPVDGGFLCVTMLLNYLMCIRHTRSLNLPSSIKSTSLHSNRIHQLHYINMLPHTGLITHRRIGPLMEFRSDIAIQSTKELHRWDYDTITGNTLFVS